MMTYEEIRELSGNIKDRRQFPKHMMTTMHGRFAVLESEKTPAIIVDANIAELIRDRRWCIDSGGYPVANFSGKLVRLHDYVMARYCIKKPEGCYVDHINHDKLDNRISNLRFVTPEESSHNMPLKGDNTSGYTGVSKTKYGTYRAYITVNKTRIDLGQYKTKGEAISARREAETRFGFKTRPLTIKEKCNAAFLCELEGFDGEGV